ncbi:MAG TPA: sodium:solute symporter family protein [Planctomycetota bacterium]|nr:sodium:solute symporter family protein [Planctomycetota bacterium]
MELIKSLGLESNFTAWDWLIVAVYLVGTVLIGLWVKRYIADMSDFIVAGRALKTRLGVATMVGTELGLVTIMYSSQKGFTGGFAAFHIAVIAAVVTLVVGLTGFIVVPLRRMGVMTIPEYYDRRFGRNVRILGGLILVFAGVLNMGMFLKAGALFVTGLVGYHDPVFLNTVMTVLLALVILYTVLGGMVSVVVTDYVQFVVLSVGLLTAVGLTLYHVGWTNIVDTTLALKGEAGVNPFHKEGFGTSYVVWMVMLGLVSCAVWQTAVMRACAAADVKTVKRLYAWSSVGFLIRNLIPYFLGIGALVYLSQNAATRAVFLPAGGADSETTLMAMPVFLSQILPVGLIGLIAAGMLAAFMSTHDSYLLCWSSVLVQDVIAPLASKDLPVKTRLLLARLFIVLIGLFLLVWGLYYPLSQDLWDYMAITGAVYFTGATVLLVFGIYWKRASRTGAYLALASGVIAVLGLGKLQERLLDTVNWVLEHVGAEVAFEPVSSAVIGLITVATATVLMVVGSLLRPDRKTVSSEGVS